MIHIQFTKTLYVFFLLFALQVDLTLQISVSGPPMTPRFRLFYFAYKAEYLAEKTIHSIYFSKRDK